MDVEVGQEFFPPDSLAVGVEKRAFGKCIVCNQQSKSVDVVLRDALARTFVRRFVLPVQ